jgi:hypothetical protein
MPVALVKNRTKLSEAILSTLSFFHIYKLPISAKRVWELLYKQTATLAEVELELTELVRAGSIAKKNDLYALTDWDQKIYEKNQEEIVRRWHKVKKYYWLLSIIPYIEHVSVINSVAMGNADSESDIDFFVITKPNRLYYVRTIIILVFKLLGVYKNRKSVNERFCFGFYITTNNLSLRELLLPGDDPYMVFWLSTIVPIIGERVYQKFIKENRWIFSYVPNFRLEQRLDQIKAFKSHNKLKRFIEIFAYPKAVVSEPLLRWYHIRHTFKLPENHWVTSTTIANKQMLKLHALDPREDLRQQFNKNIASQN